jgi:hypothetical protein
VVTAPAAPKSEKQIGIEQSNGGFAQIEHKSDYQNLARSREEKNTTGTLL